MSETLVERVAKAINPIAWSDLAASSWRTGAVEKEKKVAKDQARAAIKAMRGYTDAMFDAGCKACDDYCPHTVPVPTSSLKR